MNLISNLPSFMRVVVAGFAIGLFFLVTAASHAADNYWSSIGPFGGNVERLTFDTVRPLNALASSNASLIYSRDGGDSWNDAWYQGKRVSVKSIALARDGSLRYYVITQASQLLGSSDGGQTWSGTALLYKFQTIQVDAQDSKVLYALIETSRGSSGEIDVIGKSVDAGTTWSILTPVPGIVSVYDLICDPLRSGILYAGMRTGLLDGPDAYYKSSDGGATWTLPYSGLPAGALVSLSVDPTTPDTLYLTRLGPTRFTIHLARSTDGGQSWQTMLTNLPTSSNDAYPVIPDPVLHGTLYIGIGTFGFAAFRSVDGGTSWSRITSSSFPNARYGTVVPHPTQLGRLFAATFDGLFRTDDGTTWQEITNGFSGHWIESLIADEPRIVALSAVRVPYLYYATTDSVQWSQVASNSAPLALFNGVGPSSFGVQPWSVQRYAVIADPNQARLQGGSGSSRLFRTDDDGTTWTSTAITGPDVPDFLFAVADESVPRLLGWYRIYTCLGRCTVTSSVLVGSVDGGASWQKIGSSFSGPIATAAMAPLQPSTILVGQNTGIARSIDGGATFQRVAFSETITGLLYADPWRAQVFYSATQPQDSTPPRFYRSADGGLTWTALALDIPLSTTTGVVSDLSFSASRPDRVDVLTARGALTRSEDAGLTWKGLSLGPAENASVARFGRREPRTAYFATFHGVMAYTIARDTAVNVAEFYHAALNHYFITAAAEEAVGIDRGSAGPGWSRTGLGFKAWLAPAAAPPDARPVCRFYGTPGIGPNSHFYTLDPAECAAVQQDPGWRLEATDVFYLVPPSISGCAGGRQNVFRAYNNRYAQNDSNHRYSTTFPLLQAMQGQGWAVEGTVFCAPF